MTRRVEPRRYCKITNNAVKISLPDVTQVTDYSCGASSLQSICKYYGVGPDDEWTYTEAIHYDHRVGAHPDNIIAAAKKFKLECEEHPDMTDADLKRLLDKRRPVMLMIQAWGEEKVGNEIRWIRDYRHVWQKGHSREVYRNRRWTKVRRTGRWAVDWHDGHWVVAIGYNDRGFFFEDPSLQAIRGFISRRDLAERWRDTRNFGKHMPRYGLAIWKPGARRSMYATRAEYIE